MTTQPVADHELDCRNTLCPMPVIRLRQTIEQIAKGEVIKVLATDPASVTDMPAFARNTGHSLLGSETEGNVYVYYFRKE